MAKKKHDPAIDDEMPPLDPTDASVAVAEEDDGVAMSAEMSAGLDAAHNFGVLGPGQQSDPPAKLRPSTLDAMIAKEFPDKTPLELAKIDRARFCDERGLPAVTRLYRVTLSRGRAGNIDKPPLNIEAVDPPEAISKAYDRWKIRQAFRHQFQCHVVVIEE